MKSSTGSEQFIGIGDLAARFGLATHVLRHWEARQLLKPARDSAGRRRYRASDVTRVAVILRSKEAGMSLDTIRSFSTTVDPTTRRDILSREARNLRTLISAAQSSLELIEGALGCEHEDITECPRFRQVVAERIGAGPPPAVQSKPPAQ
jgi:DNA-binding transcriptional MerR regulator